MPQVTIEQIKMKITIGHISGKDYTIVWHAKPVNILGRRFTTLANGTLALFKDANCLDHIATALPALPRFPANDEATVRLLRLYAAHGVIPVLTYSTGNIDGRTAEAEYMSKQWFEVMGETPEFKQSYGYTNDEITHCLVSGQRVDVAITDNE